MKAIITAHKYTLEVALVVVLEIKPIEFHKWIHNPHIHCLPVLASTLIQEEAE